MSKMRTARPSTSKIETAHRRASKQPANATRRSSAPSPNSAFVQMLRLREARLSLALCFWVLSCAARQAAPPSPPLPITLKSTADGPLTWPSETEANCPYPTQAIAAHVDHALVVIRVLVDRQGYPRRVAVIRDPGFGFAQQATECAMDRRYDPGIGAHGETIRAWTPPLRLHFVR